jgi:hypothetical protein
VYNRTSLAKYAQSVTVADWSDPSSTAGLHGAVYQTCQLPRTYSGGTKQGASPSADAEADAAAPSQWLRQVTQPMGTADGDGVIVPRPFRSISELTINCTLSLVGLLYSWTRSEKFDWTDACMYLLARV